MLLKFKESLMVQTTQNFEFFDKNKRKKKRFFKKHF